MGGRGREGKVSSVGAIFVGCIGREVSGAGEANGSGEVVCCRWRLTGVISGGKW